MVEPCCVGEPSDGFRISILPLSFVSSDLNCCHAVAGIHKLAEERMGEARQSLANLERTLVCWRWTLDRNYAERVPNLSRCSREERFVYLNYSSGYSVSSSCLDSNTSADWSMV